MQYRMPVGRGPSSNTCPRCEPHLLHSTSVLTIPAPESSAVSTPSLDTVDQKLGQPVPESNLDFELNRTLPQQAHRYTPSSLKSWYLPVKAGSVPFLRVTSYCLAVSKRRHSSSLLITLRLILHLRPATDRTPNSDLRDRNLCSRLHSKNVNVLANNTLRPVRISDELRRGAGR